MEYILLMLAITLLALAYSNSVKYRRLKHGGEIPNILTARRNVTLYFVLGLTSIFAYIFMIVEMV
jgi:hypothetical protein